MIRKTNFDIIKLMEFIDSQKTKSTPEDIIKNMNEAEMKDLAVELKKKMTQQNVVKNFKSKGNEWF